MSARTAQTPDPAIGRRLRQIRDGAGISRAKRAKFTRLSEATIKLIEGGHVPSARTLTRLARAPGFASLLGPDTELCIRLPDQETTDLLRRIAPLLGLQSDPKGVMLFPSVRMFALLAVLALFAPELLSETSPPPNSPNG